MCSRISAALANCFTPSVGPGDEKIHAGFMLLLYKLIAAGDQMSLQFNVKVDFTEDEIVLLIQLLNKHILDKQWHDVTVHTPFESALITKILKAREDSILKVKKASASLG